MPSLKDAIEDVGEIGELVLGLSPAVASSAVYCSLAQSTGIMYENAVAAQKRQTLAADVLTLGAVLTSLAMSVEDIKTLDKTSDPNAELVKLLKALEKLN